MSCRRIAWRRWTQLSRNGRIQRSDMCSTDELQQSDSVLGMTRAFCDLRAPSRLVHASPNMVFCGIHLSK
jgi:hypothetical protein